MNNIDKICASFDTSLKEVMSIIQKGALGIALIIDERNRFLTTITDGDIRRAILNGINLNQKIGLLLKKKQIGPPTPITLNQKISKTKILDIMKTKKIRHIPILNPHGEVVKLALLSEYIENKNHPLNSAIVMAGGKGKRLYPLTKNIPKPMLPLQGTPLLKRTIIQLRNAGIQNIQISTHYKHNYIQNYFKSGRNLGLNISYLNENTPLGTAGVLGLVQKPDNTTLIINGDILTQVNFKAMYNFHTKYKADLTVAVRKFEVDIPYGVVETNDVIITNIWEKPKKSFLINAGIYLIEPHVFKCVPEKRYLDMTELIEYLLKTSKITYRVIGFPIQEYWLDVGLPQDYRKAEKDIKNKLI